MIDNAERCRRDPLRGLAGASLESLSDYTDLVGPSGLEPPTSRLSGARSNHLSYEPIQLLR